MLIFTLYYLLTLRLSDGLDMSKNAVGVAAWQALEGQCAPRC